MEDGDILPQTSIEPYTAAEGISSDGVDTQSLGPRVWEFDPQPLRSSSWNYFPPLFNQRPRYGVLPDPHLEKCYWPSATVPTVLSPWHFSESSIQIALTPGGNPGDEFGVLGFINDQIWENGPRPGRRFSCQEGSFPGNNLPFNQGNGKEAQLCNPNIFCTTSGQSPHVSPQPLESIPGTHINSPFERHPDQFIEAPESGGVRRTSETGTAQGSMIRLIIGSREWPCDRDGCNKSYGRRQDVKRHVREKHAILPICLICGIEWTRAEKIRRHLIKEHRDYFTKKERQQIRHLQGLNNTIDFLNEWKTTRPK